MTSQTILQLLLTLHITGFTMMAGPIIADFSVRRRLNRYLAGDKPRAMAMLDTTAGFPRLIGIGALLLVTTGIGMVVLLKGVVVQMLWFRIKMILVVLVGVNGSVVPRQNAAKLKLLLAENAPASDDRIGVLKDRMSLFHTIQFLLFLTIFVLSVFRF